MDSPQQAPAAIRTPDQRLRVFISSTLGELAPERQAAREATESLHLAPVMFELGASPHPPRTLYRAYLQQSHVFVGVYWQRYGWVAPDMDISGLEDEYVLSDGMPRLIYVKRPAPDREDGLSELLERIKGDSSYRPFDTAEELSTLLADDLAHLLSERFGALEDPDTPPARRALPIPLTRLVGREEEVETVTSMLGPDGVRLVTLVGVGGIGKSRLALAVATRVEQMDAGSVAFVDLTTVADPDLLPRSLASKLGVTQEVDRPLMDTVKEGLRRRPALLVLDNFEQIAVAAPRIAEILADCPAVKMLVTSRIPLNVGGEHQYPMRPLAESSAVELFVERAHDVRPKFALDEENEGDVRKLCGRLDGLPLALELAAGRISLLPPAALLERLGERLDLVGYTDHPERQRTLRATIDWSHDLLDEDARRLFARLAVFSGGWTLEAAEAVCVLESSQDTVDTLSSLVDKSLVSMDDSREGELRFRMLETVREYARERLVESGERESVRRRHAEYFAGLCEDAAGHFYARGQGTWFTRLDADIDNIRALLPWALETGDAEVAGHAFGVIWSYWWLRGLISELLPAMEKLTPLLSSASAQVRAEVALSVGGPRFLMGDLGVAREKLREAIDLSTESGDERVRATALTTLSAATPYETEPDEVHSLLTESVATCRRIDWLWGVAFSQLQLGTVLLRDGEFAAAVELHRESLEIARDLGDDSLTVLLLDQIAADLLQMGEQERAREALLESAGICRRADAPEGLAYCLEVFAGLVYRDGNPGLAARLLGAGQGVRELIAVPVWPLLRPARDQLTGSVMQTLGETSFDTEHSAGRCMKPEDALTLAQDETTASSASR